MPKRLVVAVLLVGCHAPLGCAAESGPEEPLAADSGVVVSPEFEDRVLTIPEDLPVSAIAGPPLLQAGADEEGLFFQSIQSVVLIGDGADTILVLDRGQNAVIALTEDGEEIFRFGSEGEGPGEFMSPGPMVRLPWSGNLAIWDSELERISVFTPRGDLLRTIPMEDWHRVTLAAASEGLLVEIRPDPMTTAASEQVGSIVRYDSAWEPVDTILRSRPFPLVPDSAVQEGALVVHVSGGPFLRAREHWALSPSGVVAFASGRSWEVFVIRGAERIKWTHPDWGPVRLGPDDRRAHVRRRIERDGMPGEFTVEEVVRMAEEQRGFAEQQPAVTDLYFDSAGRLWVRAFDPSNSLDGEGRMLLGLDASGVARRALELPPHFHPLAFTPERVYGMTIGELGVQRVEAYPWPGLKGSVD